MEPSDSGDKAVKKAFQRLALVHHPDKGGDAEKFNQLRQAYAEIATEERRADYIQWTIHRCPKRFSDYFALDDARRVSVVVLVLVILLVAYSASTTWWCLTATATLPLYLASLVVRTAWLVPQHILRAVGRPRQTVYAALAAWRLRERHWAGVLDLVTEDAVWLSSAKWTHPAHAGVDVGHQQWLVYFQGSSTQWEENMEYVACLSHAVGCHALVFNYRGVSGSGGMTRCGSDLVCDGCAALDYLIGCGVLPQHIVLFGRGVGGAVAAGVTTRRQGLCCAAIVCSHTYLSFARHAASHIEVLASASRGGHAATPCWRLACVIGPLLEVGLWLIGWRMDAASAVIQWHARGGRALVPYHPKDGIVRMRRLINKRIPWRGSQLRETLEGNYRGKNDRLKVIHMQANWEGKQAHNYPNVKSADFNTLVRRISVWMDDAAAEGREVPSTAERSENAAGPQ